MFLQDIPADATEFDCQDNSLNLHRFVTPEYGRFQSVYRSRNGVTRGTMSRLPVNIMNQISRRFHIGGKTKRKKKIKLV